MTSFLPRIALGIAAELALSHAAGYDITSFGFSSMGEVYFVEALLFGACIFCFWATVRFRNNWLILPALLIGAAGLFFAWGASMLGPPSKWITVKGVHAGWSAHVDTMMDPEGRSSVRGRMDPDSGDVFVIETHINKIHTFAQRLICFNLEDGGDPVRYAKGVPDAAKAKLIYIHPWEGKGSETLAMDYDFLVVRTKDGYAMRGRIGEVDVSGEYVPKRDPGRKFLIPPGYPRTTH